jgi:hypothetical protein
MSPGKAGRVSDDREHFLPEDTMGSPREIGGVHSSGIGDKDASQSAQDRL